jgi:hypothetical protein
MSLDLRPDQRCEHPRHPSSRNRRPLPKCSRCHDDKQFKFVDTYLSGSPIQTLPFIDVLLTALDMSLEPRVDFLSTGVNTSKHVLRVLLTKPAGISTLACPTFFKVSMSSPVSGSRCDSLLAGQTQPVHCASSMEAEGFHESTDAIASSSLLRYEERSDVASSVVKTPSS